MKSLFRALAFLTGLIIAVPALASTFTLNVDSLIATTAYTSANMASTWVGGFASFNFSGQGASPSTYVVATGTNSGGVCKAPSTNCIEYRVPAGALGVTPGGALASYGTMGYIGVISDPGGAVVFNLEWDQLFETNFDMHGIGKVPLSLGVWDATAGRYQTARTNWQCTGSYTASTCSTGKIQFVDYLQNDATGGHNGCTSTFLGNNISKNVWYHFKQQEDLTDRAHPILKIWITGTGMGDGVTPVLTINCTWTPPSGAVPTHNVQIAHNSWFGGAGSNDKSAVDSYEMEANITAYTGSAAGGDVTAPSVPTGVFAATFSLPPDQATAQVQITWNASTDDTSVTGYNVKRDNTIVCTGLALSCIDTVTAGGTYVYTVNAFDAVPNSSAYSTGSSITMIDTTAPTVPTGLAASVVSSSRIDPSWSASTNYFGHPTTYHVRRDGSIVCTTTSLTCSDTGLTSSHQYSYTVDAADAAVGGPNNSAQSSAVLATTSGGGGDVTAPSTPGNFHLVSVGSNFISFAWNASTDDTAVAAYRFTCGGSLVATVAATTYLYNNLTPSTSYTCSVQAIDAVPNVSTKTADVVQSTLSNSNFLILTPQALSGSFTSQ